MERKAIIIGIASDIGHELALRLLKNSWQVSGTYFNSEPSPELLKTTITTRCDLSEKGSVDELLIWASSNCRDWDLLIIAAGTMEPIGEFWDADADLWEDCLQVNALTPVRIVRALYPLRRRLNSSSVAFFSGAGTNSAAPAYSAYAASKVLLIKLTELLDAESTDTSFFIIGPGIVLTKIHKQTLEAGEKSGTNLTRVLSIYSDPAATVQHDKIYECLQWCVNAGKATVGGRNISLVNDIWEKDGERLGQWLREDTNHYKLRRFGNEVNLGEK
jgi:NAD(P)-dependent dehydrogenase (short-subunit alcohol dehydrogenase family)